MESNYVWVLYLLPDMRPVFADPSYQEVEDRSRGWLGPTVMLREIYLDHLDSVIL